MSTVRFVILHHRQRDGEHWDLMIEQADTLATWQLARNPLDHPGEAIPARRIADHRKLYLDYEGPVSLDRGEVRRVEAGTCDVRSSNAHSWQLWLEGQHVRGEYALTRGMDGAEQFAPVVEHPPPA